MDIIDINISNNKYSNVSVTNKTKINNFNLGNYDNIIYINNIRNEVNNSFVLDKSNSTYIVRDYNSNVYRKYITEVDKSTKDTFVSNNHNLKKNDIIKLYNINKSDINLLKPNLQNTDITYKVINVTRNTFRLVTFNNSNNNLNNITDILVTSYNNITNGYFELESDKSSEEIASKILNVNINNEDDDGVFYNLVIDSDINELTVNTLNNDKLSGYILFNKEELIGPDYLSVIEDKSTLHIKNINLEHSRFEFINLEKNKWFIKCNISNKVIKYNISYSDNDYKLNGSDINLIEFYKGYTYILDIGDTLLENLLFIIVDSNGINYYKNIIKCGDVGIPGSYIKIYIDNDEIIDNIYTLKYIKKNESIYTFKSLYIIKNTPIYFT